MAKIPSPKSLWRVWLKNESPRRPVISWSGADKACLLIVCFIISLISSWQFLQVPDFGPGIIASTDLTAPKDAEVIYEGPRKKTGTELIKDTIFVQVIDETQSEILKERIQEKLNKIELLATTTNSDRISPVSLTKSEKKWLTNSNKYQRKRWREEVLLASNKMLKQGLVNTIGFDELREASELQLNQLGDKQNPAKSIGSKVLARTFHRNTNLRQDRSLQGLLEDIISKETPPIKVKRGDFITRRGEPITLQDYYLLNHFNLVPKTPNIKLFSGTFLESLTICLVLILIMRKDKPCITARHSLLALILLLLAQASKIWFGSSVSPLAVLTPPTLLLSQGIGAASAFAWIAICSFLWQVPSTGIDETRLLIAFAASAIVAFQGGRMRSRAQLLQMTFLLPFGALLGEWFFIRGREIPNSSDELVYQAVVLGGLLILAILLIPILETTFGLITKTRLMELADQERPLLRRLSLEAPGTFEHTMMICGLAEEGARAIDADIDLIRTGALYHDIGKLHAPDWFIENQTDSNNPHDDLQNPYASAAILQAHVDEGLILARKYRLPKPIADFIPEHQGTLKMGYFLHKAREKDPLVPESLFRYNGPIPRCRETAILMLADGCEAALRSLNPNTNDQEACLTARSIVESRQKDGQLKDSSLTRAEVELVIRAFVSVWRRSRHRRIPYPITTKKS